MNRKERDERNAILSRLDGIKIGRYSINLCTSASDLWLTVYPHDNMGDEMDEQLSFSPEELFDFCREVTKIANKENISEKD
jgi:hypothetical protein